MTKEHVSQPTVRFRLTVVGEPILLDAFLAKAKHPTDPTRAFVPSRAVPAPADLEEVDPFAIPYYHYIQNQHSKAADALDALDAEPELAALLRDPAKSSEARELLHRTLDRSAMAAVPVIRKNVREFNAMSRAQWTSKNWGRLDDRLVCENPERPSPERAEFRFTWHLFDLGIVDELAVQNGRLRFGLIGVDEVNGQQAYTWQCADEALFQHGAEPVEGDKPTWLDRPPLIFL